MDQYWSVAPGVENSSLRHSIHFHVHYSICFSDRVAIGFYPQFSHGETEAQSAEDTYPTKIKTPCLPRAVSTPRIYEDLKATEGTREPG